MESLSSDQSVELSQATNTGGEEGNSSAFPSPEPARPGGPQAGGPSLPPVPGPATSKPTGIIAMVVAIAFLLVAIGFLTFQLTKGGPQGGRPPEPSLTTSQGGAPAAVREESSPSAGVGRPSYPPSGTPLPPSPQPPTSESQGVVASPPGPQGGYSGGPSPASSSPPQPLNIRYVSGGETLRVEATYQLQTDPSQNVVGFQAQGAVTNIGQGIVPRAILTFVAQGALVLDQSEYRNLLGSGASSPASQGVHPHWNSDVVLAYQTALLPNLAPGETRPFSMIAPCNFADPPGLKPGQVIQSGSPQEVALWVNLEKAAPTAPSSGANPQIPAEGFPSKSFLQRP